MFKEYDVFRLKKALADDSVPIGTRGVVLIVYQGPPRAYEVEFPDGFGGSLGSAINYTITDEYMDRIMT
jgi:Domain of unknown function (DUF4926)